LPTSNGNKVRDWVIRNSSSTSAMIGYEEGSTNAKVSVYDDGLINPSMLKVRSGLIGNYVE